MSSSSARRRVITASVFAGATALAVGLAAPAAAAPGSPAPAITTVSDAAVAPVTTVHLGPDEQLGGFGTPGAVVTVTDRDGDVVTTHAAASGLWFVPLEGLRPAFSIVQSVDGQTSQPVTWGASDDTVLAPVDTVHNAPDGRLGGRGTTGATVTVTDAAGAVRTTTVTGPFWFVDVVGMQPGFTITQSQWGQTSSPVSFR